jgi:exodeoxyribonuclease V beta subunit
LLSSRLADYQPDAHLGPALYWFLRGSEGSLPGKVAASAPNGVLTVELPAAFILALDALFRGDAQPARFMLDQSQPAPSCAAGDV